MQRIDESDFGYTLELRRKSTPRSAMQSAGKSRICFQSMIFHNFMGKTQLRCGYTSSAMLDQHAMSTPERLAYLCHHFFIALIMIQHSIHLGSGLLLEALRNFNRRYQRRPVLQQGRYMGDSGRPWCSIYLK